MDRIDVSGIEGFGYHGVLDHERQYGQRFAVDVSLGTDLAAAGRSDDLADTIDYGAIVNDVRRLIEGPPVALIESLAERIADACLAYDKVDVVEVSVHKPAAPVSGVVDDVVVTIRRLRSP